MKTRNCQYPKRCTTTIKRVNELPVYGNLVTTPAQMMKLAEKGVPISSQNMQYVPADGEPNPSWDITLDRVRGVDPAQLWEESQAIKAKARNAHIRDRKLYGDDTKTE